MTGVISLIVWALVVVVVWMLLIGWRCASIIRRDLLRIGDRRSPPGVWVRALGAGTITLEAKGPRQDVGHPGVIGLCWDDGYAQAGEVVAVEAFRVTRELREVWGGAPPVCLADDPASCPPVGLDPWFYPSDPGDAGLQYEETEYISPLGRMGAWLIPHPGSRQWAIHVHGLGAARRETVRLLPAFHRAGLSSLVIDYRNDPGLPSDPSGHHRFGLTEWNDVEAAMRHVLGMNVIGIVLVGYSTGAAHVLSFLEHSALDGSVRGVVLDSPNVILAETVRHGSPPTGTRPGLPFAQLTTELGMWIADRRWGIDWEATDYVSRAEGILTMPTLVFHGTSDHEVPISVSRQLEARVATVTLVETQAAGHVRSWNADPSRYERHLEEFLAAL